MLAPEPFFEPRGTPFSEYHRIKALGELGHHVDLVTYPIGRDVELPNLRIFRSLRPPFVRKVRIGPSATKVVLDGLMLLTIAPPRLVASATTRFTRTKRWDWSACGSRGGCGIPHLYDMHSSLPQQLSNFKYSQSSLLRGLFTWAEDQMVHGSQVVITICQELQDTVDRDGRGRSGAADRERDGRRCRRAAVAARRPRSARAWGIARGAPLVLYTGTFEAYQGVDMLIDAAAIVARRSPMRACWWSAASRRRWRRRKRPGRGAGASAVMVFTGQQPAREIPGFVQACDLLVSPRIRGTNTPLKIYSYLRSGKPIVATNLLTHTQVLTPEIARLVEPEAGGVREAMLRSDRRAGGTDAAGRGGARGRRRRNTRASRTCGRHRAGLRSGCRRSPADVPSQAHPNRSRRSCATGEGARDRRDRIHRRPSRAACWRPRRSGARAGAAEEPRPLRSIAAAARGCDRRRRRSRSTPRRCGARRRASRSCITSPRPIAKRGSRTPRIGDQRRRHASRARGGESRRRASCRALQHGRRARPHRASAGERGRAVQSRRRVSGDQARGRSSSRASSATATGLDVVVARPIGIYGPGDTRFLKMFRGLARGRFPMIGSGQVFYHLTYIDDLVEGFRLCGTVPAAGPHLHPGRPALHDARAAGALVAKELDGRAAAPASAGVAVLDGRACCARWSACRCASSRRSIAGASISTRRAARSTRRARAPSWDFRRRSISKRASSGRRTGIDSEGLL